MLFNSADLILDLIQRTRKNIEKVEQFKLLSATELNTKITPESWSILECIEHLHLYGDFYLPEIESRIKESSAALNDKFNSGWLGNYFANSMLPKEGMKKIKTFRDKNPVNSSLNLSVIERFVTQQNQMLELLEASKKVNLNKVKTSISITPLIKLRLGDTFRFVIYHNERHIVQAQNVLNFIQSLPKPF